MDNLQADERFGGKGQRKRPIAYFLTFTTYGTHLIGDECGSVDNGQHCQYGQPLAPPNARREAAARARMREPAYVLNRDSRRIVREAIVHACTRYGWDLSAVHVRTTHVHAVVAAVAEPEVIRNAFKAFASRALKENGLEVRRKRRWTAKGSQRFIWTEKQLSNAIDYVVNQQGLPMEVWTKELP